MHIISTFAGNANKKTAKSSIILHTINKIPARPEIRPGRLNLILSLSFFYAAGAGLTIWVPLFPGFAAG